MHGTLTPTHPPLAIAEEVDFIINYDSKYCMGREADGEDEGLIPAPATPHRCRVGA